MVTWRLDGYWVARSHQVMDLAGAGDPVYEKFHEHWLTATGAPAPNADDWYPIDGLALEISGPRLREYFTKVFTTVWINLDGTASSGLVPKLKEGHLGYFNDASATFTVDGQSPEATSHVFLMADGRLERITSRRVRGSMIQRMWTIYERVDTPPEEVEYLGGLSGATLNDGVELTLDDAQAAAMIAEHRWALRRDRVDTSRAPLMTSFAIAFFGPGPDPAIHEERVLANAWTLVDRGAESFSLEREVGRHDRIVPVLDTVPELLRKIVADPDVEHLYEGGKSCAIVQTQYRADNDSLRVWAFTGRAAWAARGAGAFSGDVAAQLREAGVEAGEPFGRYASFAGRWRLTGVADGGRHYDKGTGDLRSRANTWEYPKADEMPQTWTPAPAVTEMVINPNGRLTEEVVQEGPLAWWDEQGCESVTPTPLRMKLLDIGYVHVIDVEKNPDVRAGRRGNDTTEICDSLVRAADGTIVRAVSVNFEDATELARMFYRYESI